MKVRYLELHATGELARRARVLEEMYRRCTLCPRNCKVDRSAGKTGGCYSSAQPAVASYTPHFGEEPPISATRGSGTIFFANCNLHCVYCQNHQISQLREQGRRHEMTIERLAAIMLELQADGCHNINFVSPTHFTPAIVAALDVAAAQGLRIPLVYNSNGYDSLEVLRLLDGVIEIYLPDIKYAHPRMALRYSKAPNYPQAAREAIREMHRQVGELELDAEGAARKGLLIRHLVLPDDVSGSLESLEWIASELGTEVSLSVMAQYYPTYRAWDHPPLHRRVYYREYAKVTDFLEALGLERGWVQSHADAPDYYQPDFDKEKPFADG